MELLDRCGADWFTRKDDRLRAELSFVYGIIDPPLPFVWWSARTQMERERRRRTERKEPDSRKEEQ